MKKKVINLENQDMIKQIEKYAWKFNAIIDLSNNKTNKLEYEIDI